MAKTYYRLVSTTSYKGIYYLYLANIGDTATHIAKTQLVMRRSTFPPDIFARIICGLAGNRVQLSRTTPLAAAADVAINFGGAVVPPVVNTILGSIPINGNLTSRRERAITILTDLDQLWLEDYILNGQFSKDLQALRSFALANNLGLVSCRAVPFILPSVTCRINGNYYDSTNCCTIPTLAQTSHVTYYLIKTSVLQEENMPDTFPGLHFTTVSDTITKVIVLDPTISIETYFTPGQFETHTEKQPIANPDIKHISYHTVSDANEVTSSNEASAYILPLMQFSTDITESDPMDLHFGTLIAILLDAISDISLICCRSVDFLIEANLRQQQMSEERSLRHRRVDEDRVSDATLPPGGYQRQQSQPPPQQGEYHDQSLTEGQQQRQEQQRDDTRQERSLTSPPNRRPRNQNGQNDYNNQSQGRGLGRSQGRGSRGRGQRANSLSTYDKTTLLHLISRLLN